MGVKGQLKCTWHSRPARATLKDTVLTATKAKTRTRAKTTFEMLKAATCSLPHAPPLRKKPLMFNDVVRFTKTQKDRK